MSQTEIEALEGLAPGGLLITRIGDTNETDPVFGTVTAGMKVYKKLIARGLAFITEEDLMFEDDPEMGTFTPTMELTAEGEAWLKEWKRGANARFEAAQADTLARRAAKSRPR